MGGALGWRILVSVILIPAFVGLFYLDHRAGSTAPVLLVLVLLLAVRSVWELVELFRTRSFKPSLPQTAILACAVVLAGWTSHVDIAESSVPHSSALNAILLMFVFAILWLFASNAARYREPGARMETLGAEILIVSYVGVLFAMTTQLRWVAGPRAGYLVLGATVIAVKAGDIGAYTIGRLFGRRKMSPHLSPGKTWAGAFGALIGGALGSWAWLRWAPPLFDATWEPCSVIWSIVFGVAMAIAGLIGDLCESLIKRDLGKKDAAALMPGFGGLLDLLDSVIYAGPVAYVLWQVLPLATWPM